MTSKREFKSARHAQRRALYKACQAAVKGTKWRSVAGVLVGERDGWFLAVHEMTDVLREQTKARLIIKPMAIDPIFWDIVGEPQLRKQGLTFRYRGALTCPGLILGEPAISEEGGVEMIAARMLEIGEAKLAEIAREWTAERFLRGIAERINPGRLFATTVCTLIVADRKDEALALCDQAVAERKVAGFVSRRGGFPQMATNWLRSGAT